jgi:hypothetical protein
MLRADVNSAAVGWPTISWRPRKYWTFRQYPPHSISPRVVSTLPVWSGNSHHAVNVYTVHINSPPVSTYLHAGQMNTVHAISVAPTKGDRGVPGGSFSDHSKLSRGNYWTQPLPGTLDTYTIGFDKSRQHHPKGLISVSFYATLYLSHKT